MKAKLIIDNKELEVEISEEEVEKLKETRKPNSTGYEKVCWDDEFWYINECGGVEFSVENYDFSGPKEYNTANYYSDETVAKNNARADTLMRQLRRFAVEHRQKAINYKEDIWCELCYDFKNKLIRIDKVDHDKYFGTICFNSYKTAELAIEYYKDELLWYFTEYKDSL